MNLGSGWLSAGLILLMFAGPVPASGDLDIPPMLETPRPLQAPETKASGPESPDQSGKLTGAPQKAAKLNREKTKKRRAKASVKSHRRPDPGKKPKPVKNAARNLGTSS